MFRKTWIALLVAICWAVYAPAQTTNGLLNGVVTDPTGAFVPDAQIQVTNTATQAARTAASGTTGAYIVPQLAPGTYKVTVSKSGFASVVYDNVILLVNQSITLNVSLGVAATSQTVEVTGAAPLLNTTSPTLSTVVDHDETVDLPLNGRAFTQLALLTPGVAPVQNGQQNSFVVSLGAGGISPSSSGQRGEQNNFTMDGVLNNQAYLNTWIISPPPDAIQEFNVQTHITDAQFAISSGANINVVTRSGTNSYHGTAWEFIRNSDLDAQTYPDTERLPYRQNQYGLFFGGPLSLPHIYNAKDKTWFAFSWEGFRSVKTGTSLTNVITDNALKGDFSEVEGTTPIGYDCAGNALYQNEIFMPSSATACPGSTTEFYRTPFPGNKMDPNTYFNKSILKTLTEWYPGQNLNVADGTFPNYKFASPTKTDSDIFGLRLDQQITANDTLFLRFNRSNQNRLSPESLPTYHYHLKNYGYQGALGFTHLFDPKTILNFHYSYSYVNYYAGDQPAGATFADSINFTQAAPEHAGIQMGPQIGISNGFTGTGQFAIPLGPMQNMDYHADLSKVISNHTLGAGAMYYHLRSFDDGWGASMTFNQNGTSVDGGSSGGTGYGEASFLLGVLDNYSPWVGVTGADQTVNWWGMYVQDQWQVTKKLVLTGGLRWDYVSPPNYHKIVSGLDVISGKFMVTAPVSPWYQAATAPSGLFDNEWNGWEPRLGATYQATPKTVVHAALAMLDDHNNTLIQENQNIRLSWPSGIAANILNIDNDPTVLGVPKFGYDTLPSASSLLDNVAPYASYGANPHNKIPYAIEYNLGAQEQLLSNMMLKLDYVGSVGRHQYIVPEANTAPTPGPGAVTSRSPYGSYGGPFSFSFNEMPSSYNALQVQLQKNLSQGLYFTLSYTWSKSMDWQSDPYNNDEPDFYNLNKDWGRSDFDRSQMFVFTSVYQLPFGKGKSFLTTPNRFVQNVAGNWSIGGILTMNSGAPFNVFASGDVANTGGPGQRAQRDFTKAAYSKQMGSGSGLKSWLNTGAFAQPTIYTYGNESRNDLVGPAFKNLDFNLSKNFQLLETSSLQFRAEFFNIFNHPNFSTPDTGVLDAQFGQFTGAANSGREIQFALKLQF